MERDEERETIRKEGKETNRAKNVGQSRIASRESRSWAQVWVEGPLDFVLVVEC